MCNNSMDNNGPMLSIMDRHRGPCEVWRFNITINYSYLLSTTANLASTNFVQNWCDDSSSSSNTSVITSSRPRSAVALPIGTICTIVASSTAGIGDWNTGDRSSTGIVLLAVNLMQNYALWAFTRPNGQSGHVTAKCALTIICLIF